MTMSQGPDRSKSVLLFEPINQNIRRRPVIRGCDVDSVLRMACWVVEGQMGAAQTDAINLPMEPSLQWFAILVERELDAR